MSTFNLNIGTRIVIYGAGQLGKQYLNKLKSIYEIVAFFDINAEKIKDIENLPVYNPFEIECSQDVVVILCLHNAVTQVEVADKLYQYGYNKIIFIPVESIYFNYREKMQKVYTEISEGIFIHENIPSYKTMARCKFQESVIRKSNTHVVANVDIELMYVGGGKQIDQIKKVNSSNCSEVYRWAYDKIDKYANKPIIILEPYINLFYSFMTGKQALEEYICMCKPIQNMENTSEDSFIQERFRVYSMLEQKLANGIEEFYTCPVEVEWNERGYFETIDGHHRSIFLYCKGIKYIPVRMEIEDYEKWLNRTAANEFSDFIEKKQIKNFCTHVPNPLFSKMPYRREYSSINILTKMMAFIGLKNLKDTEFLDLSDYNSYFARHFYRMGAKRSVAIESDYVQWQTALHLNQLLFTTEVEIKLKDNKFEFSGKYDIAFVAETLTKRNKDEILNPLNKNIRKMIIWEYDAASQTKEYILNISKFNYYKKLTECCTEGKLNEVGVFCINANFEF